MRSNGTGRKTPSARWSPHLRATIQEPPHFPQFVLDVLETADDHQLEDQAVDVPLDLRNRLVSVARPGLSPRGRCGIRTAPLAVGTPPTLLRLGCPCLC